MKTILSIMISIFISNIAATCNLTPAMEKEKLYQSSQGIVFPLMHLIEGKVK